MLSGEALDSALLAAIDTGRAQIAQTILGAILENPGTLMNLSLALHRAAIRDLPGVTKLIIPLITPANSKPLRGMTFLHSACKGGSLDTLKLFVERITELHVNRLEKSQALGILSLACKYGHCDIVNYLAEKDQAVVVAKYEGDVDAFEDGDRAYEGALQKAMEASIASGQYSTLEVLLCVLPSLQRHTPLLKSLIEVAISSGRTKYCREIILQLKRIEPEEQRLNVSSLTKQAIFMDNLAILQDLLGAYGINDRDELTRLIGYAMAWRDGGFAMVRSLVAEGSRSCTNETYRKALEIALLSAILNNCERIATLLIEKGVDLEIRIRRGRTLLLEAAYCGYAGIVQCLIKAKADLNAADWKGWRPIHAACDDPVISGLLAQAGADINAKTDEGSTAVFMASTRLNKNAVQELLKYKPELNCMVSGCTELSSAIEWGITDIVTILLEAGVDPCRYQAEALNLPPLHSCIVYSQPKVLKLLLAYNFRMDETDSDGNTALNCINVLTKITEVKLLVARGASVDTMNKEHDTPLAKAIRNRNFEMTEYLISKVRRINDGCYSDYRRGSLLHIACSQSSLPIVKLLVNNGADVNFAVETIDSTPLQAACLRHDDEDKSKIISFPLETGKVNVGWSSNWWGCNLNVACLMANLDVVDFLLKHGARVDVEDDMGRQPIHFALYRSIDIVKRLCEKGANMNGEDEMKRGALHFAVASGKFNIVKYVLEQRKDLVSQQDIDGWTPLHWAMRTCGMWKIESSERAAIIEELCRCGADRLLRVTGGYKKWTAYSLAKYHRLGDDIIKLVKPSKEEIKQIRNKEDKRFWRHDVHFFSENFEEGLRRDGCCNVCFMVSSIWSCTRKTGFLLLSPY